MCPPRSDNGLNGDSLCLLNGDSLCLLNGEQSLSLSRIICRCEVDTPTRCRSEAGNFLVPAPA